MELEFTAPIWFWKGPAPWHFITVPEDDGFAIEATVAMVSYGWGMIPVTAWIGDTAWTTSLFPKDGTYVVPVKTDFRRVEGLEVGDVVQISLTAEV